MSLTLGCAIAGLLAMPAVASAATRYAAPDGTGPAATCPQANPCSLEDAVNDASVANGDTVVAGNGTYLLSAPLVIDASISVGGAPQAVPTIVSTITPQPAVSIDAAGAQLHDVAVVDLDTSASAVELQRGTVDRVLAESNGDAACTVGATGGGQSLIRDSVCWSGPSASNASGLEIRQSAAGTRAAILRNVTAWASGSGGEGVTAASSGGGTVTVDALNVIAHGGSADVAATAAAASTASVALTTSNFSAVTSTGAGTHTVTPTSASANQADAPMLRDPDGGDFDQLAGSPTIDSGSTGSLMGTEDLGGEPRVQGPTVDIGADERDGTAPKTTILTGPAAAVTTGKVTFTFSSNEPGSTFECRIDDAAFKFCSSPYTSDSLTQGDHAFAVRATDQAGNVEATPATRLFSVDKVIAGANVSAKRTQRPEGRQVVLAVSVKADELARVRAGGSVRAGHKSFRFQSGQKTLVSGTQLRLTLKPVDRAANRKIIKSLKKGKKVEAHLTATFIDLLGNTATSGDIEIRLK